MSTSDERGIEGHLSIEKARVWDLKSTGQVTTGGRTAAGIACICFHPTDPTLCVVTVQGTVSVLSFYNAHSGGKMSTVPLQSVVSAAQFTKDGNQIVVIFRDWTLMMLKPGSPVWSKSLIPFKKDTRPAEHLLLALSPTASPVIYFAPTGQQKINVAFSSLPVSRGSLLSSSQKNAFATKLTSSSIMGIACHPEEDDLLLVLLSDGMVQCFALEQMSFKKLYSIGDASQSFSSGCQFEVLPHPFITGAVLIFAAAGQSLLIYASHGRTHMTPVVDDMELKGFRRISGLGIHHEAHVLLVFGESADGKVTCVGSRFAGSEQTGVSFVPVNVSFGASATEVSIPDHSVSGVSNVSELGVGSWMDLWDAVPAWAQSASHIGSSKQRIRSVKMHSITGAIAAHSMASGSGGGPHIILWSINDASHPFGGSHTGLVVPQHTSLSLWTGQSEGGEYKLEFPHHCYFASGNKLSGYGFRSKAVTDVMTFRPPSGGSGPARAETVVFSTWHRAWLIFFRSFSANDTEYGIEEWTYTIQREDEVGAAPPWFKQGVSGVFIGPKDDHCCILDPDLYTVHVFPTKTVSGKDAPLLSLSLPSPGLLTPAIFQGPPITQIPKPPVPPEFTNSGTLIDAVEDGEAEVKIGYGVIIWVNKFRQIAMGTMISETDSRRTWSENESTEFIQGGTFNELSEGEIIIQVSWQILSEDENAHQAPNSFTAAVLTNQRLMLFLANGYPVLSFPPQNSPGLYSPPMSCLWVGPALLYVTRTGEVNQLLWDGSTVMICGAPSTTGSAVLAAALADRILFLCRETESQSWQVATRHAIIGYALLMGWASLASSGLMPPAWLHAHARNQMKTVLQHFDASTVSAPVARTLVQSDFADVARIITNRWPKEAQKIKVACSVAARNWAEAAEGLMNEHQCSVYHPGPIPKGSTMWKRFYTVATGAMRHGQTEIGAKLFAAAGEWEWALIFLSLSPNSGKMQDILKSAEQHIDSEEKNRIQALADQLKKRAIMNAGVASASSEFGSEFSDLSSWSFAAAGYLAPMHCVQGATPKGMIKEGDIGLISPLETTDIKGYVSGASKQAPGGNFLRRTITNNFSGRGLLQKASLDQQPSLPDTLEVGGSHFGSFSSPKTTTPKHAPKSSQTHGFSEIGFDEKFSSDEEDEASGGQDIGRRSGSGFGKKFKIQIKKKEEGHGDTSSEALREAAKNLRLGGLSLGPGLGPGGFAAAMKGGGGVERAESVSSVSSSQSHIDLRLASGGRAETQPDPFAGRYHARTGTPVSNTSAPSPTDPFKNGDPFVAGVSNPGDSFQAGVKDMESGNWPVAIESLSKTGVLNLPRAKQYLAAVMLLNERASLSGSEAARLDRYAASLELEDKHRKAVTLQAVRENMGAGNYGYAKERLEWLIESSKGQLSGQPLASMQQQLQECVRHQAADSDISPFENLASVAGRIESVSSVEEMKLTVAGIAF